jgi:hypothetical protein
LTFAKKVAARLAQFTLLLAFVGLTSLPGLAQERATQPHIGLVQDWSHRHIIFTDTNDVQTRVKASGDVRALSFWVKRTRMQHPNRFGGALGDHQGGGWGEHHDEAINHKNKKKGGGVIGGAISGVSVDWALNLGGGKNGGYAGLSAGAYPAKYSFDINADPDCTNDYIAMGLNNAGGSTFPNLIGVNNLYSNSVGSGFCNGLTAPTTYFAYFTAAPNPTSVVLSMDGTKIAWVENAGTPVLHVLAWQANDGTLDAPVDLSAAGRVVASAPAVGSGTMTSLTLTGAVNDTNSAPYVDYNTDTAYVGSDNGLLFKVKNVFCQTIASPAANSTCATAQPSLDGSWGTNPVTVAATTALTSPVVDTYLPTPLVFVGAVSGTSRGSVFARIAATGAGPATAQISPGRTASGNGGVVDPPVIDVTNHKLYATAGCATTNNMAVAVQNPYTSTGFGTSVTANIGRNTFNNSCPATNMHAGTPDDAYITTIHNGTAGSGNMIFCGTVQASSPGVWKTVLYKFPVAAGVMSTTAAATSGAALTNGMGANANAECSAVTDLFNSNFASQKERIYMGLGGASDGHLRSFDATFTTPAASVAQNITAWSALVSVITLNFVAAPAVAPGNYVTVAGTSTIGGVPVCNANTQGTFEVLTRTATQITFNNPAVTNSPCNGANGAGTAIGDSTIQSLSIVDATAPFVNRATSGIIIDNVAATGSFAEASNIYFTQLGPGNIAGGSCPATATIVNITRVTTTETVNTAAAHGLTTGDTVTIAGNATAGFNGVWIVASTPTTTSFTFTGPGVGATGAGGSVFAKACIYKLSQSGLQ